MAQEDITPETLPEDGGQGAVDGDETVATGEPVSVDNLTLEEINSHLGKDFPTKAEALKSIKDTYSFVGKKQEDFTNSLQERGYMTEEQFKNEMFLKDNPQHAENAEILKAIAKDKKLTLEAAAKTEGYSKLVEASAKYKELAESQSVMDSSPRLAEAKEEVDKIRDLKKTGQNDEAEAAAARAVLKAYE